MFYSPIPYDCRRRTAERAQMNGYHAINSLRPSDAHICVDNLAIIGSDKGLSPGRRQAIIWTNDGIFLIGLLGTKSREILIEIHKYFHSI